MSSQLEEHYRHLGEIVVAAAEAEALIGAVTHSADGRDLWPTDNTWLKRSATPGGVIQHLNDLITDVEKELTERCITDADNPDVRTLQKLRDLREDWKEAVEERHRLVHSFVTIDLPVDENGAITVSTGDTISDVAIHPKSLGKRPLLGAEKAGQLLGRFQGIAAKANELIALAPATTERLGLDEAKVKLPAPTPGRARSRARSQSGH